MEEKNQVVGMGSNLSAEQTKQTEQTTETIQNSQKEDGRRKVS